MAELVLRTSFPTENSQTFHQGMVTRMDVGMHKYGKVNEAKGKIDYVESIKLRLKKYEQTGNTEYLMDIANFAMIEWMHYPDAFRPTDSDESPGLKTLDGETVHEKQ